MVTPIATKEKVKVQIPLNIHIGCVSKDKGGNAPNNCKATLRIERFHEGQEHMIVTKQGQPHNHEQNFANHIRKDLMEEIKKQAIDFYYAKTGAIVEKVLAENEAFGSFYESGSCFPQKKSKFRAVQ